MTHDPPSRTDESGQLPSEPPRDRPPAPDATPAVSRLSPLNISLAGFAEMDYFASDAQREIALRRIGAQASRLGSWGFWSGVGSMALIGVAVMLLLKYAMRYVNWPGAWEDAITFAGPVLASLLLAVRLHRKSMPVMLRSELLVQGVPVCMKCGYLLRGLTVETGRCPECGRGFDERVREILESA
ncbi:MAG: hypothetical protein HBSAPP02_15290 [Phycisphaerae bacterium]|nr:MAG: hypothetical protein HRU71_07140 [Planctomycetia bacterium]RIK71376.1 MAG: hypothetical protein DCC66_01960 [Planctomycetota bacterium]GJQ26497.1 MAG: hypothetical protein HBSAPP02_15290 [Phycisphaerae bacterium]